MLADVFQSDNLLAACLHKEISYGGGVREVDIARKGDVPMIRPIRDGGGLFLI